MNGILLDDASPSSVARAMIDVLTNPAQASNLASGALQTGRKLWSWQERLDAEIAELERLVR